VRKAKRLSKVKSCRIPRTVIFLDTETRPPLPGQTGAHPFRLGWVCVRRERPGKKPTRTWTYLDEPHVFWHVLDRAVRGKGRVYLLAHRIVYDLWVLGGLAAFRKHGYKLKTGYASNRVVILRFRRGETALIALDTLNLFPGSLEKWGDEIGLPKGHVDFWNDNDKIIREYCMRDVMILVKLWELYLQFVRRNRFGGTALTVSGLAFRAFRHRFMPKPIYLHNRMKVLEFEREAYYGGRTECWRIGLLPDVTYTIHDVNSMYPFVMRDGLYPVKLKGAYRGCTVPELTLILKDNEAVARVRVCVDDPIIPLRRDDRPIYPVGEFETVLAGPELRLLLERGAVVGASSVAVYERGRPFVRYVKTLYALRKRYEKEGRTLWASLLKLMLNGLYGKFGQLAEEWKTYPNTMGWPVGAYRFTGGGLKGVNYAICMGEEVWVRVGVSESPTSFPAIAAYVTSYARVQLLRYVEAAGAGNVIYCDTDSVITTPAGTVNLRPFVDAERLGALKVEYEGRGGEIRSPKDYRIGEKTRTKGLSTAAVEVGDNTFVDTHWPGFWGLMAAGKDFGYATTEVVKVLKRKYLKGKVRPDGVVEPFRL